jgi:hypothetical protein
MDFDLKDLGATLVTGAYFLLGVIFLFYLFSGARFVFFLLFAKRITSVAVTILILSLAFGAGILLEDISNDVVDSDKPNLLSPLLPLERDLRAQALFGKAFVAGIPTSTPAPLSREAAKLGIFTKYEPDGFAVQAAVMNKQARVTADQLKNVTVPLYYEAKNTVYREANYYNELRQIQTRIDFARSSALLSLLLAVIGLVFAVTAAVQPNLGGRIALRWKLAHQALPYGALAVRTLVVPALIGILFLGRFAYCQEEMEFDKRVYGYFFSLTAKSAGDAAKAETDKRCGPIGYSGLASIDKSTFLVVHDTKADCAEPRLGTLTVHAGETPLYAPLKVNWGAEPPNDFEAACSVPGKSNDFLVTESGYYNGKFGRIFHITLTKKSDQWNVEIRGKIDLPRDTDNVEGLACIANRSGGLTLLLGERGDSAKNPTGMIRWAPLDLINYSPIKVADQHQKSLVLPPTSAGRKGVRGCADLYVDEANKIWTAATEDRGDDGPFRSVIYQVGTVEPEATDPVQILPQTTAAWTLDGVKVEGLNASPFENSPMSVATDDEHYEGIWRPLFPSR